MHLILNAYKTLLDTGFIGLYYKFIEWRKNKKLQNVIEKKNWDKAVSVAKELLMLFPEDINYRMKLARCYQNTDKKELAFYTLQQGLNLNLNLHELIKDIHEDLKSEQPINSRYVYLGGWQNLGIIEHQQEVYNNPKKLITKISSKEASLNELLFYSKVINQFPQIKTHTPELINIRELNNEKLCLITMEKINGANPKLDDNLVLEVINISETISSMKYQDVKEFLLLPKRSQIKLSHNSLMSCWHYLSFLHLENTNHEIFDSVFNKMNTVNYSNESIKLMSILKSIILGNQLYKYIVPEKHYSIQHGDFSLGNMIKDNTSGKIFIIDWGHMRIGPRWIDIAGFLGRYKIPFYKIEELYFSNPDSTVSLDPIERSFFIYTLIITWFYVFSREEFEQSTNTYIAPAIQYLKKCEKEIKSMRKEIL